MHPKELMILLMFLASLMIIAFAAGHYIERKKKEACRNNLELYYQKGLAQGWKEATEDIDQKLINLTK
jgi:hypothetical protein